MSSLNTKQQLLKQYCFDLLKALEYLDYSYKKVQKLPKHFNELDPETLEGWESFSARYARCADIFTSKYLRLYLAIEEPGFRGSTKDYLNKAEKLELINSSQVWTEIRELRNMTAHEYSAEAFDFYIEKLLISAPEILKLKQVLPK